MTGDFRVLLVVLFSAAGGIAVLLYLLRARRHSSGEPHVPSPPVTSTSVSPSPQPSVGSDTAHNAVTSRASGTHGNHGSESRAISMRATPAESSHSCSSGKEALRSDVGAISDNAFAAIQHLENTEAAKAERSARSPDEIEASSPGNRENSVPVRAAEVGAPTESPFAEHGSSEAGDSCVSRENGEAVSELNPSEGDGGPRQQPPVRRAGRESMEADADGSPQPADTTATRVAEGTDRQIEEQASAGDAGLDETAGTDTGSTVAETTTTAAGEHASRPADDDKNDEPSAEGASTDQFPQEKGARRTPPHRYKGLERAAPQPPDATRQRGRPEELELARRTRSAPIEVRLRFDRGGVCSVSLIAQRSAGLPENLPVVTSMGEMSLRAMQDEWYQDVIPDDIPRVLQNGTVWTHEIDDGRFTWSLGGRELYVLADRRDISGYVSQPCLGLGRTHVVLCTERLRSRVEEAIQETGAQPTTVLDESFGAPSGWIVFRNIVPHKPVSPQEGPDIFNALRPLPQIEIRFERGIRLRYADWLDGNPPSIRVYGGLEQAAEVRIDGQIAERGLDGSYGAPGWDAVGPHRVWCAGTTKSYSIVPFDASWQLWDAYAFPSASGSSQEARVCGPMVRTATSEPWDSESVCVPETNPVLLGPKPGQIAMAVKVSTLRGAPRIASPGFRPIWALPRNPLHCNKMTTSILGVGVNEPTEPSGQQGSGPNWRADGDVVRWCRLILDASRKGMVTDPNTESVRALWHAYKRRARHIWRLRR